LTPERHDGTRQRRWIGVRLSPVGGRLRHAVHTRPPGPRRATGETESACRSEDQPCGDL
jgi:hypothetical protein